MDRPVEMLFLPIIEEILYDRSILSLFSIESVCLDNHLLSDRHLVNVTFVNFRP